MQRTPFPHVNFHIHREEIDELGIWNPVDGQESVLGGLQINIYGNRENYLQLAEAIRKFAQIDSSNDGDFHQHFDGIMSVDGRTRLDFILRKDDVGDSIHQPSFPKVDRSG